jgi:hypothetical protein
VPNTLWLQLYEFSRFRGIINSYGQRAVYEIQATLAAKISKMKVGRNKNLDFDRQKPARTSQKMVWFKSFRRFFNFPSSICRSEARNCHVEFQFSYNFTRKKNEIMFALLIHPIIISLVELSFQSKM